MSNSSENVRKSSGNWRKSLKSSESSETVQNRFLWFWKIFEKLQKRFETVFEEFFLMIFIFFGKSFEVFGKICRRGQNCSEEKFRSCVWEVFQRIPAQLLRAINNGKVEWNTTRSAEYATVFFWLLIVCTFCGMCVRGWRSWLDLWLPTWRSWVQAPAWLRVELSETFFRHTVRGQGR